MNEPDLVTILYTAQARARAGMASETVPVQEGDTIESILQLAIQRHGPELRDILLDPSGQPRATNLLFVNGRQIGWATQTPARPGDEILVLTPMSGG
jgi:molybdopterin converting factor small subunit